MIEMIKSSNIVLGILGIVGAIMILTSVSFMVDDVSKNYFDNLLTLFIVVGIGLGLVYISLRYGVKKIDRFLSR